MVASPNQSILLLKPMVLGVPIILGNCHSFFFCQSTQVGSTMEEAGNFLFPLALQASVAPLAIARWVEVSRWSSTV